MLCTGERTRFDLSSRPRSATNKQDQRATGEVYA